MIWSALLLRGVAGRVDSACEHFVGTPIMPEAQQRALAVWTERLAASGQPLVSAAAYPFCFVYGGVASSKLLPSWHFAAAAPAVLPDGTGRTLHAFTWTEPRQSALQGTLSSACVVELNVTLFAGQLGAADAVLGLRNDGGAPTAVVTRPASLSTAWASPADEPARLYSQVGGNGGPTDFNPAVLPVPLLSPGAQPTTLQNQCGTGSFGTLPFLQIEWPTLRRGLLFSLGWSGQWLASISRNVTGAVSVSVGLGGQSCGGAPGSVTRGENDLYPAFQLAPGEWLRLLRILTVGYNSSTDAALHQTGLNIHRRLILDAIAPRARATPGRWPWSEDGVAAPSSHGPIYPLVAAISNKGNKAWLSANERDNQVLLDAIHTVPGEEEIWIDVGWSTGGDFGGNYAEPIEDSVDRHWWPNGSLAPVFHRAHTGPRNVQTVLWFMPEMNLNSSCDLAAWGKPAFPHSQLCSGGPATNQPSYLAKHHPEWLAWELQNSGPMLTSLVDLGIPAAREYTVRYLSQAIASWEIDTFRIESSCNGGHDCLVFFQAHDAVYQKAHHPGLARNGTTEIGHVLGLHRVFDELREKHPGLVVDVCAGGGRKIDLDIMERSIQKWQSDFTSQGDPDPLQGHLMGEQHYQPLSAAGIWAADPYTWRSVATTGGLIFFDQRNLSDSARAQTAAAIAETKRLRPLVLGGDYFVLTNLDRYGFSSLSSAPTSWAAWQWANTSAQNGAALFFRRTAAPESLTAVLNHIDRSATYDVKYYFDYALNHTEQRTGAELQHFTVSLPFPVSPPPPPVPPG